MKTIASSHNPFFKELKALATNSQARRKAGRTLLDGVHLCQTYLATRGAPPYCVLGESARAHPEVAPLVAQCLEQGGRCVLLPDTLFHALSQVENGVALLFVVDTPQPTIPAALAGPAVLLDRLQDPGNLGSILRSAAAAGIGHVYCSPGTAFAWSPKVLRAGMGAHFLLEICENVDLGNLIDHATVPVLATSPHSERTVYAANLARPVAWLFGHEGQGVAPDLMDRADQRLAIPHLGPMESLNVAACVAVCLFEQVRQRNAQ